MSEVKLKTVSGSQLEKYIPDLARLRIEVFREYPYLYSGSLEYEAKYLATYTKCQTAMAVIAFDDQKVIGASTGIPLSYETEEFKSPFINEGMNPEEIFYCGESVLLEKYRGRGLYKDFFNGRENFARSLYGIKYLTFCGVVRKHDHPLKPQGYTPLDEIWKHFGYSTLDNVMTYLTWQDIDQNEQTSHLMQYWMKSLN